MTRQIYPSTLTFAQVIGWNLLLSPLLVPGLAALYYAGVSVYQDNMIKGGYFHMPEEEKLIFYMRMTKVTDVELASETMLRFEDLPSPFTTAPRCGDPSSAARPIGGRIRRRPADNRIPLLYHSLLVELADVTRAPPSTSPASTNHPT